MAQRRNNKEIQKTQEFIAKAESSKKKSYRKLFISVGTVFVTTALSIGIVLTVDAAKNDEI